MSEKVKCKKCGVELVSAQFGLLCKPCMTTNKFGNNANKVGGNKTFQKPMKSLRRSGRSK